MHELKFIIDKTQITLQFFLNDWKHVLVGIFLSQNANKTIGRRLSVNLLFKHRVVVNKVLNCLFQLLRNGNVKDPNQIVHNVKRQGHE